MYQSTSVFTYYNIPSNNRELQQGQSGIHQQNDYNIPSNNRELQHFVNININIFNYNIPSNNRELQHEMFCE